MTHVRRAALFGGSRSTTVKRYRAILDKFLKFCSRQQVAHWQQVGRKVIEAYGNFLEENDYAYATQFIELSTVNQVIKFLALDAKLIATSCYAPLKLEKPDEVTRYAYTRDEVVAMLQHCRRGGGLGWLGDVITALATTGLRIGELAGFRWSDLDLESKYIRLPDTSRRGKKTQRQTSRTTKGGYTRFLPIHRDSLGLLSTLKKHQDGKVFHGPLGGALKPDTVRNVLIREVIAPLRKSFPDHGDEPSLSSGRLHSFRHYFVSAAADEGTPEPLLMCWPGHKSSAMVRRYYHARQAGAAEIMSRLNLVNSRPAASPMTGRNSSEAPKASPGH